MAREELDIRETESLVRPTPDASEPIEAGGLRATNDVEFETPAEASAPTGAADTVSANDTASAREATDEIGPATHRLERVVSDARYAADHLEERLALSARLLKAVRQQTAKLDESLDGLVERRRAANEAEASLEERLASVDAQLEQRFAAFDARLDEATRSFDVRTAEAGRSTLERCEAIARIVQEAEVNVALMLARVAELVEDHGLDPRRVSAQPSQSHAAPPPAPVAHDPEVDDPTSASKEDDEPSEQSEPAAASWAMCDAGDFVDDRADADDERDTNPSPANDSTERVLATVAEELRTPVETVSNVIGLLAETQLDDRQRDYIRSLRASIDDLLGMLETAPDQEGDGPFAASASRACFQLEPCIDEAVTAIRPSVESVGGSLDVVFDDDVPRYVEGDARHLRQALIYALTHATREERSRSWVVDIGLVDRITRSFTVRFVIRDATGPRFDEVETSAQRAGEAEPDCPSLVEDDAAGLGLVIARQMIEALDGQLGVARVDGERRITWFTLPLSDASQSARERRIFPRLAQEGLNSNLGPVLDLSINGMRVRCVRPPEGVIEVELYGSDETVAIRAEVTWARRVSFRRHEVGLRFLDVSPDCASRVSRIAMDHRWRKVLP